MDTEKPGARKRRELSSGGKATKDTPFQKKKPKSKKSKKKEQQAAQDHDEERRLTSLLFGGGSSDLPSSQVEKERKAEEVAAPFSFEIDRTGISEVHEDGDRNVARSFNDAEEEGTGKIEESGVAWVDEDDADLEVDLLGTSRLRKLRKSKTEEAASALNGVELEQRLRQRYQSSTQAAARTDWANLDEKVDSEEDQSDVEDEALQSSSAPLVLQGSASQRLPPNILNIMRCPDANLADPNKSVVQAVNFHPGSDPERPLLLTAGLDKTLRFFQVGAEKSEKVHGIHFPNLPIYSASFLGGTGKVVVSGRRPFFYIYDTVAGKLDMVSKIMGREEKSLEKCVASPDGRTLAFVGNDGYIPLVDTHSKHWIADLKMNGSVRTITFSPDGNYIIGSGSDGDIYRWDVRTHKCVERFSNEDGSISSSMASSSRHLAVGAESGVVNLYSEQRGYSSGNTLATTNRKPTKSIMNLKTSADLLRLNGDGQILAMSTRRERNSMKLLHVPSGTVFSNWPTSKTPLNYVWSMDFSPESKFLAIGNDKGKCLLYQMMHYKD